MEKSTKIPTIIKYLKKALNVFFLSVILIDSVFRAGKNRYPQVFLDERKHVVKEKKMPDSITDYIF